MMHYAPEPGYVRRYIYFDRTWDTPDPRAAYLQRMKYAVLAKFGMTEYQPSDYLLLVEAPPHCHAAETIDWRPVWSRDTLAAAQANYGKLEIFSWCGRVGMPASGKALSQSALSITLASR